MGPTQNCVISRKIKKERNVRDKCTRVFINTMTVQIGIEFARIII